jgi:predicted phage baseplate assembly protein
VSEVGEIVDDTTIRLVDSVDADIFIKADTRVYANVVLSGHGERKPEKILGSGNAMLSNQSFTLDVEGVAFIADATKSSGVAVAMEVEVAGQIWEQVSTLKDSAPGDHHYAIRMTEEGYVKILFGDGEYGRRLPSGKNNIRVRYRVGSGLAGNVPVGGLEKPVNPHPLIDAVRQPLHAAGGGDMEDVASLRENAPSTLLALERAVSLSDFSHLAAAQSSVWQAKAYSQILHGGRTEIVKVVIVLADGVTSQDINETIGSFLQSHALPGVQVQPEDFEPLRFGVKAIVRVKPDEFIAEDVVKEVISALSDHFTLKNRKLGEHLYLSEVYKVVEGVKGVENSICEIYVVPMENDASDVEGGSSVIVAGDESTVIYLVPDDLSVDHKEYLP